MREKVKINYIILGVGVFNYRLSNGLLTFLIEA